VRVAVCGESLGERLAIGLGLAPVPVLETMFPLLSAQTVMVGCRLGVFEALAERGRNREEIASALGIHASAAHGLLDALVSLGYLHHTRGRYTLARKARRWLLADSPDSMRENILYRFVEWELLAGYEDYVRTGKGLAIHERSDPGEWGRYQRGMRAIAGPAAAEVARRLRLPSGASAMLDLGGSHGLFSVRLCQRHPRLRSTILDLPDAVRHAAPILAREEMGERVVHREGDARTDDLGQAVYDVVLASSLMHHFDDTTNRVLTRRVARALRPGGVFAVLEVPRPRAPGAAGQAGALLDLLFGFLSGSGTWSIEEIQSWQRESGLQVQRPFALRRMPNAAVVAARKTAAPRRTA
jgi:SAM-dependent methyltransferase